MGALEKFAIMAVDPGGTTGVATALLNGKRAGSTAALLRRAVKKDALRVEQVEPAEAYRGTRYAATVQAGLLYRMWHDFVHRAYVENGVPINCLFLVIEDFQLRQRSADMAPIRVTEALLAHLAGRHNAWDGMIRLDHCLRFQQPSEAMTYATNERLRRWGVWSIGKQHGRDATRHLALLASKALAGELEDPVRG